MFKSHKSALLAAMTPVNDAINRKSIVPILNNVLIERDGDRLTARAGNQTMEITAAFEAEVSADFRAFTCPAMMFRDIVNTLPDGEIRIDAALTDDRFDSITVKSGRSRLKLPVLPASDFPKLDAGTLPHQMTLAGSRFEKALAAVAYAASTEVTRYYLCGVFFQPGEQGLSLVTTDGHRLERRLLPVDDFVGGLATFPAVIVSSDTVKAILKLIDGAGEVQIELSAEKIRVAAGDRVLTSKLLEGVYPDWMRIVPQGGEIRVEVAGKIMSAAIVRVMTVTPDASSGVRFTVGDGKIGLDARDTATGEGEDEIDASVTGALAIRFNGKYVRELLDHRDGETIEMIMTDHTRPALIRAPGDPDNFSVLMPTRGKGAQA